MKKFIFTYSEGNTINKKAEIEAETLTEAVAKFELTYPNAVYEKLIIAVVKDEK